MGHYFVTMYLLKVLLLSGYTLSLQHIVKDEVPCECKESSRCSYWISAVKRGKYLDLPVCGYNQNTLAPLLCCPGSDVDWTGKGNRSKREVQKLEIMDNIQLSCTITPKVASKPYHCINSTRIADQKCVEYGKLIYQSLYKVSIVGSPYQSQTSDTCAKSDNKNEDFAEIREFPHMALIGYGEEEIKWLCGGSLISERFILSTADCVQKKPSWVKLGELDLSTDDDVARPQIFKISKGFVHPDYEPPLLYNDIGLLKLERDVPFTIFIRPACVFARRDPADNKADATGWGTKYFGSQGSDTLKKIKMDLVPTEECNKHLNFTASRQIPEGIIGDLIICAVESDPEGLQVCKGDAGGPLQIALKEPYCMYGIIGLTSFGVRCGNKVPGGYTRVAHYVPWIVNIVWSDDIHSKKSPLF